MACVKAGHVAALDKKAAAALAGDLSPSARARVLWIIWQCREQTEPRQGAALNALRQYLAAVRDAYRPHERMLPMSRVYRALYVARDHDAADVVLDACIEAAQSIGRPEMALAMLERAAIGCFLSDGDRRIGLRRWRQYLDTVMSTCAKDKAIHTIRRSARAAFGMARRQHRRGKRYDRDAYRLPILALTTLRENFGQTSLTVQDQQILASAYKAWRVDAEGAEDCVREYETLLRTYPEATREPAAYLGAIEAHLVLAQKTDDYARAAELIRTLHKRFPDSAQSVQAELEMIRCRYVLRGRHAQAKAALDEFEKRHPSKRWAANAARLRRSPAAPKGALNTLPTGTDIQTLGPGLRPLPPGP